MARKGLGKGLDSLIPDFYNEDFDSNSTQSLEDMLKENESEESVEEVLEEIEDDKNDSEVDNDTDKDGGFQQDAEETQEDEQSATEETENVAPVEETGTVDEPIEEVTEESDVIDSGFVINEALTKSFTWKVTKGSMYTDPAEDEEGEIEEDQIGYTLTIEGEGPMPDFPSDYELPWSPYSKQIRDVGVGEGITRVGNYSFHDLECLDCIDISHDVEAVGAHAFETKDVSPAEIKFSDKIKAIQKVEEIGARYGIGRDCHVGDTIIGIKGRVGFEAAAPMLIIGAHRYLEKFTLSKWQQYWKEQVANWYGMFLHESQYLEPVMPDIEAMLLSSQRNVTGEVTLELRPLCFQTVGVDSPNDLVKNKLGEYGETAKAWTSDDAKGFIKVTSTALRAYYLAHPDEKR